MDEPIPPDDQIEAQMVIELINELMHWVVEKSKDKNPRQVCTALLFSGAKVTELHILDKTQAGKFIDETIELGRNEAIRCLKLFAEEQNVDAKTNPPV